MVQKKNLFWLNNSKIYKNKLIKFQILIKKIKLYIIKSVNKISQIYKTKILTNKNN